MSSEINVSIQPLFANNLLQENRKRMKVTMARRRALAMLSVLIFCVASLILCHIHAEHYHANQLLSKSHYDEIQEMQALKVSLLRREAVPLASRPKHLLLSQPAGKKSREFMVTSYGADPTGKKDSTNALLAALADACKAHFEGFLFEGIVNLGGARINLEGGHYVIRRPLRLPAAGWGNLMIHGGTLRASQDFPINGYLIDLSGSLPNKSLAYNYEYITFRDLLLDSNYRGGGIAVINSLRTGIDNCYITHFTTNGILVQDGHETYIRNSFLGQHITAGEDPGERNFSGTAISLIGNDNAVTDVIIFSASIGVMISGQANTLSGVHCYNKATGFGGTGIYLKVPGLTQTRIINSYMDYTGIVAEDPVQLDIADSFFLGDAYIMLKSIDGVASGVNIVDNMFSGSNNAVDIVQLDQSNGPFKKIDQVIVDRNNVKGMNLRATIAEGTAEGNYSSWTVDFNSVLLFPNLIRHVQYSFSTSSSLFANHALRNVSGNRVLIEADKQVPASVFVLVYQAKASIG